MVRLKERSLSLVGEWEFRQEGGSAWQSLAVPGCWEQLGIPHDWEGVGIYRYCATLPTAWQEIPNRRIWLRFGAVSYSCEVFVNGKCVGEHKGAWSAFTIEITEAVENAPQAEIVVRVLKPGGATYPTKQTTAGFLPYVWGYLFGGIWQEVTLEVTGAERIPKNLRIQYTEAGSGVRLLSDSGEVLPEGLSVRLTDSPSEIALWSPQSPRRYTAQIQLWEGDIQSDAVEVTLGFRNVTVQGDTLCLNGSPIYPRMPLSWGWYPETLHANPDETTLRAELEKVLDLGYNGVKACLWVPPPRYLDLCDELGLYVWLELPLWLPEMDATQRENTLREYEEIVRQVRHHPSIILWTLGCELSHSCPDEFLSGMYTRVKELADTPLLRDNSGGGECYGGLLKEYADYYDYHFYCDLHLLRNTFDYFLPHWRPTQPWLFGEFCDADAFRDLVAIKEAHGGELPWWAVEDTVRNPQGVRWDMHILGQWANMEKYSLFSRREELKEGQRRQTLLHRKHTVELVRSYRLMSGYVVTGLVDTPISIAGMFDDFGDIRYTPEEFSAFNADTVLFLGWHRRRNWVAGGDHPSYIDQHCHWAGDTVLPRLGISHYGAPARIASAHLTLGTPNSPECYGTVPLTISPDILEAGAVQQVGIGEITLPLVDKMTRLELRGTACLESGEEIQNAWSLWVIPRPQWSLLPPLYAYDPDGKLVGLERHNAEWTSLPTPNALTTSSHANRLLIATRWHEELTQLAQEGERILLFVERNSELPTTECPFWREAMKLFEPHPLWDSFVHEGFTDLQFYGIATDAALLPEELAQKFPNAEIRSVLKRVDARTFVATDYISEVRFPSGGCLLISTLRPHGGIGDQPDGLLRSIGGLQLLFSALSTLVCS